MHPTPQSERLHIALYGRCNSGKSSLINALTGEQVAVVSPQAGTTTDVVRKAMELHGVGAVLWLDTPGLDDHTLLGEARIREMRKTLERTDMALLLLTQLPDTEELALWEELRKRRIPTRVVLTKCDLNESCEELAEQIFRRLGVQPARVSALTGEGVEALRKSLAALVPRDERLLTEGLCEAGDVVLLVMPQDESAPKGRLIQPQVQTLRELLDRRCIALCSTPDKMEEALASLSAPPRLIITDSQVFDRVYRMRPEGVKLTSFSVLMARYKGDIHSFVEGARHLLNLKPGARILIAEACSHTPQNEDIGRVKLPALLRKKLGSDLKIDHVNGADFPDDLSGYDLVIHCGACMFNRRHVLSRLEHARQAEVPMTNYGIAIAALQGILEKISY